MKIIFVLLLLVSYSFSQTTPTNQQTALQDAAPQTVDTGVNTTTTQNFVALDTTFALLKIPVLNPTAINLCPIFPFPTYAQDLGTCPVTDCGCKDRYVSIRAVAFPYGQEYVYWASVLNYSSYSWPGNYYNYQQCTPSWANGDAFIGHQHCDGTWSFQRKDGSFLSANRLYSRTDGCPERWRLVRSGNGYYIQNFWTGAWLTFNCRWYLSTVYATKVIVEFWA